MLSYRYARSKLYRKASSSIYVISLSDKDLQRNKSVNRENENADEPKANGFWSCILLVFDTKTSLCFSTASLTETSQVTHLSLLIIASA